MFAKALAPVDALLNRVTMYRLVVLYLAGLLAVAMTMSWRGTISYDVLSIAGTAAVAVLASWAINRVFAATFGAPKNDDSAVITGLILALIVGPAVTRDDYVFVVWAATLAMASKYVLAWRRVHLFNPAAIAVVITAAFAGQTASWWIGNVHLTPYVVAGGLLLVRKIRRGDLVLSFLWATFFATLAWDAIDGMPFSQAIHRGIFDSPLWFLAFVMLTEPITTPPTRALQMAYGVLAGLLAVPQAHVGATYLTPELALVLANAAALPFRSMQKRQFHLDRVLSLGPGLMDFLYVPLPALAFQPGQYMEWTLDHEDADGRGKRRFFTLASSPTERFLRIGVKFPEGQQTWSSFKEAMAEHAEGALPIAAGQLAGDFTLPRDRKRKLAFIAGGIGVTPFRSMVKYLVDRREQRDVVLLYANRHADEILYGDVFWSAQRVLPFRAVYALSDPASAGERWLGEVGRVDAAMIARQIPDYLDRLFYVSGSPGMVRSSVAALRSLGVKPANIKTDYFSGL